MVANPRAAKHFAMATMQRSKTDPLDALMLREFVTRMEFRSWARPEERWLELWSIARRLQALRKQRVAEKNRQHAAGGSQAAAGGVGQGVARKLRGLFLGLKKIPEKAQHSGASACA